MVNIGGFLGSLIALPVIVIVIVIGTIVVALGFFIGGLAHGLLLGGTVIVTSIIVFAAGEMIASPKAKSTLQLLLQKKTARCIWATILYPWH